MGSALALAVGLGVASAVSIGFSGLGVAEALALADGFEFFSSSEQPARVPSVSPRTAKTAKERRLLVLRIIFPPCVRSAGNPDSHCGYEYQSTLTVFQ